MYGGPLRSFVVKKIFMLRACVPQFMTNLGLQRCAHVVGVRSQLLAALRPFSCLDGGPLVPVTGCAGYRRLVCFVEEFLAQQIHPYTHDDRLQHQPASVKQRCSSSFGTLDAAREWVAGCKRFASVVFFVEDFLEHLNPKKVVASK